MGRYAITQPQPEAPTYEGDRQFTTLNMKLDRAMLPAGSYAYAENKRTYRGVPETRPGVVTPKFANEFGTPTAIYASAVYHNPNGLETMLLAKQKTVVQLRSGSYPTLINYPAGVELEKQSEFVQAFDKILLFRGKDLAPLQWDGLSMAGFVPITKRDPSDTDTKLIPNADTAISFQSRIIIPTINGTDIVVSDVLDYTSYDPILSQFHVSGTSDPIVRLFPYIAGAILIGKAKTISALSNFTNPAHPEAATLQVLSSTIGTVAAKSWAMIGSDVFFLNEHGVYSISTVFDTRIEAAPVPISDPIEPLIRRINFAAAAGACAVVHGFYYYLAVPLDGSKVNNAVLVFNTVTRNWEAFDTFNAAGGMQIDNLFVSDYFGDQRVYAINHGTKTVHLMYEGKHDEFAGAGTYEIFDRFETRGYATLGWNGNYRRDFKRCEIAMATWNPLIRVTELTDSTNDGRLLTVKSVATDPAKNDRMDAPDFDLTNVNGDFANPGRQDYSVTAQDTYMVELENQDVETKQRSVFRFSTKARGRYVSYRVQNTQGSCDIEAVTMESSGVNATRRAA